jgi:hypothetical protein
MIFWRKEQPALSRAETDPFGTHDIVYPTAVRRHSAPDPDAASKFAEPSGRSSPRAAAKMTFVVKSRIAMHNGPTSREVWLDGEKGGAFVVIQSYPDLTGQTPDIYHRVVNEIVIRIGVVSDGTEDHRAILYFADKDVMTNRTIRANLPSGSVTRVFCGTETHGDSFFSSIDTRLRQYHIEPLSMESIVSAVRAERDAWTGKIVGDSVDISRILAVIESRIEGRSPPSEVP